MCGCVRVCVYVFVFVRMYVCDHMIVLTNMPIVAYKEEVQITSYALSL